ncbi:MAG: helix-turn-helix transcriptional regulator [Candidatus Aquilonibacter sp.]
MNFVCEQRSLGAFLLMLRERIPPASMRLGPYQRLMVRCGRRVTQEELAEVVGVSRGWYRQLESDAGVRASIRLLDRLADALAATPEERMTLFTLAVPEMRA